MNQAELLRLAEIAKVEVRVSNPRLIWIQEDGHDCTPWNPNHDLNQAFECLNAKYGMRWSIESLGRGTTFSVLIYGDTRDPISIHERSKSLPIAICKAVLEAKK
jgi:hypothetical protein